RLFPLRRISRFRVPFALSQFPVGAYPHRSQPRSLGRPVHKAKPEWLSPPQPPSSRRRNTWPACCTRGVAASIAMKVALDSDPQRSPAEHKRYKQPSVLIRRDPMQRTRTNPDGRLTPLRRVPGWALAAGALAAAAAVLATPATAGPKGMIIVRPLGTVKITID